MSAIRKDPDTGVFGLEFVTSRLHVCRATIVYSRVFLKPSSKLVQGGGVAVPSEEWSLINSRARLDDVRIVKGNVSRYLCLPSQGKHWSIQSGQSPPLN